MCYCFFSEILPYQHQFQEQWQLDVHHEVVVSLHFFSTFPYLEKLLPVVMYTNFHISLRQNVFGHY
jgi:hypothetical protein